jgi:Fe-S-cluster containining protein
MVTASFKIGWHGRELSASVSIPVEPISPRRLLPMIQQFTNSLVGMGESLVKDAGETVSCKAGCGACCRQLVPVSETEARHLRDLVEAMPEPRRTEVKARFADALERLTAAGLLEKLRTPNKHTRDPDFGMDYLHARVPCPFLEAESCSIHPDRPLVCREFLVTSPAEHCVEPRRDTVVRVPTPGVAMSAFAVLDGPAKFGIRWVPLVMALEWADTHPEPPSAIPGPKLFELFMNTLLKDQKIPPPGDLTSRVDPGHKTTE